MGGPLVQGDIIECGAERGRLLGYLLIEDPLVGAYDPGLDPFGDYYLFTSAGGRRIAPIGSETGREPSGVDPLHGCATYELGTGWRARFDAAIAGSAHPWALDAPGLLAAADADDWRMFVVGGLVRDLLLGADPNDGTAVNDFDVAGTLPISAFREFVFQQQFERADRHGGRRNTFLNLTTTERAVVHVRHVWERAVDRQPFLQYAALKIDYDRLPFTSGSTWVFGTSFADDARYRDIAYNTLMYWPAHGLLIDPTGHGLTDLGLDEWDLQKDPERVQPGPLVIHPIDLPPKTPETFAAQAIARVLKQLAAYVTARADTTPVAAWCQAHAEPLTNALTAARNDTAGARADLRERIRQALKLGADAEPHDALPWDSITTIFGKELSQLLEEAVDPYASMAFRASTYAPARLTRGAGLAVLQSVGDAWRLGDERWPAAATTEDANAYFEERLRGYRAGEESLSIGGAEVVVATLDPPDPELPRYVELLSSGNPVPVRPAAG